jgi:hypothetical protein
MNTENGPYFYRLGVEICCYSLAYCMLLSSKEPFRCIPIAVLKSVFGVEEYAEQ